jgi:AcrR family transcriptional regulator
MPEELKTAAKDKIFKAASELFSRDGYYKVSVREICEAAGVTKPVLYYYFKDKENLLFEMMIETNRKVDELISANLNPEMKFEKQIEGIIKFYLQFVGEYPHLVKFSTFIQFMAAPEKIKQYKHKKIRDDWAKLNAIFEKAQNDGELISGPSPLILSQNFLGTIIIIVTNYMKEEINQTEFEKELYEFLEFWKQQFVLNKN